MLGFKKLKINKKLLNLLEIVPFWYYSRWNLYYTIEVLYGMVWYQVPALFTYCIHAAFSFPSEMVPVPVPFPTR